MMGQHNKVVAFGDIEKMLTLQRRFGHAITLVHGTFETLTEIDQAFFGELTQLRHLPL